MTEKANIKPLKQEAEPELVLTKNITDEDWYKVVQKFNHSDSLLSFIDISRPTEVNDFRRYLVGDFRVVRIEDTDTHGKKAVNTIAMFGYHFSSARSRVAGIFAVFLDTKFKEYFEISLTKFLDWIFNENDVRKAHIRLIDRDIMIKYFLQQSFIKVATLEKEVRTAKGIYQDVVILSKII